MSAPARRQLVDVSEMSRMLGARITVLAPELLPQGKRAGHEWTCGSIAGEPGNSMSVHLSGARAGVWADFASGEGGDALDLVSAVLFSGNIKEAIRWSRRWLGIDTGDTAAIATARRAIPSKTEHDAQTELQQAETRAAAKRIWLAAQPDIGGTPVAHYLRRRGIELAKLAKPPRALRYHPELWHQESRRHWPAMVSAISGPGGYLATHRTYLEIIEPSQVRKAPVENNKMTLGTYRGGHISLQRGASNRPLAQALDDEVVNITEGIEDALSVAVALEDERVLVAVSLANMAALILPEQVKTVRLWRQNDKKDVAIAAFERAMRSYVSRGIEVRLPDVPRRYKDANDYFLDVPA